MMQVLFENLTFFKFNFLRNLLWNFFYLSILKPKLKIIVMKTRGKLAIINLQIISFSVQILFLVSIGKNANAQINEDYFEVYHAKTETWAGGAYGSGSSESYSFSIKFKKDVKISFDTVWVGGSPNQLTNTNMSEINKKKYLKGDTAKITLMFYYPGERDRLYNPDKIILEEKQEVVNLFPNDKYIALIKFYVNNVKYYYEVKKVDESIFNALP